MTEIVKDMRATGLRKVQEEILYLLGEMNNEIDALPKIDEVEQRAQNLGHLIGRVKNTVFSFGELFTGEVE